MQFLGGLRPNASVGQRAADADPRAQPSSRVYGKSFHSSPYIWPRKMSPNCERGGLGSLQFCAQYASIFRLLLKVAVSVTHQCALSNFCKASCLYFFATPPCGRRPWPAPGRKKVLSAAHVGSRPPMRANIWTRENRWFPDSAHRSAYLLSLLAMIKCSICSYQCDN